MSFCAVAKGPSGVSGWYKVVEKEAFRVCPTSPDSCYPSSCCACVTFDDELMDNLRITMPRGEVKEKCNAYEYECNATRCSTSIGFPRRGVGRRPALLNLAGSGPHHCQKPVRRRCAVENAWESSALNLPHSCRLEIHVQASRHRFPSIQDKTVEKARRMRKKICCINCAPYATPSNDFS